MKAIRADLGAEGRLDILERVMSYRGGSQVSLILNSHCRLSNYVGYSQQERRRIEHEAFSGNLLGIVATNALELGVDIGVLDVVLMLGFPVGVANFVSGHENIVSPADVPVIASTSWSSWPTSARFFGSACCR